MRPSPQDFPAFAQTYIQKVGEEDILETLIASQRALEIQLETIPDMLADHAYAVGKWSVRQVLRHVIDTERIFSYRALCFARGEQQPLPSFDEGEYAGAADAALSDLAALKEEFLLVRRSTIFLFRSFPSGILKRSGTVGGSRVTVHALAYMIIGHWRHHAALFRERYGIGLPDIDA